MLFEEPPRDACLSIPSTEFPPSNCRCSLRLSSRRDDRRRETGSPGRPAAPLDVAALDLKTVAELARVLDERLAAVAAFGGC